MAIVTSLGYTGDGKMLVRTTLLLVLCAISPAFADPDTEDQQVFVDGAVNRYHSDKNCRMLRKSSLTALDIHEAVLQHLPCRECNPAVLPLDEICVLQYTHLFRSVDPHQATNREFITWFQDECEFKKAFCQALLCDLDVVGEYGAFLNQAEFQAFCRQYRTVLRRNTTKAMHTAFIFEGRPVAAALTAPTIPDHGGAALFVLSVFRQVCQDLHLDVAEFSQLAIAYSVVWDLAITSGYGKPQQMLASCNYIRAHMRMFLLWNRSGQLVFDLRRLSWEDAKRVISAGFGLHFRHPIDLLGKYHDGNWKGTVQKTYAHFLSLNPEMPGATEELADKLFKMRSKRSPIRISKNCGYWSRYFTVVAQTVGIPAVESHEEVVFLRPHGQFTGGLRRDGITHYFCAFKRANDGKWFFGKNIITQDPAEYGARTPIPGELTLDQFKSLSPAVLYRADIRLMEIVIGETQLGSAETIVFRVQTVNR